MEVYQALKMEISNQQDLSALLQRFQVTEDWTTEKGREEMHKQFMEKFTARADLIATT